MKSARTVPLSGKATLPATAQGCGDSFGPAMDLPSFDPRPANHRRQAQMRNRR